MKRYLLILFAALFSLNIMADNNDYQPIDEWPFVFEEFKKAKIFTVTGKAPIQAKANIHLRNSQLWFVSSKDNKTKLEAQPGTIKRVEFSDGETFIDIEGRLCKILRQDTINGKPRALYCRQDIDMEELNRTAASKNMGALNGSGTFLENYSIDVATTNAGLSPNATILPLVNVFFIGVDGDIFRFNESSVMKHLSGKEERNTYRSYQRNAEIIYRNLSSAVNVYTTFFLK